MARDFRAKQVRTSVIIGSGSIENSRPHLGLVFYSASKASDFNGVRTTGGTVLSTATQLNLSKDAVSKQFGDDVWCLFDGQSAGGTYPATTDRADGSTVLFLGDVVVSGSLFAERQSIEVDTTAVGNFYTPDNSEAKFAGGFGTTGATITNAGNISTNGFVQSNEFKNHANVNLAVKTTGGGEIHFDSHTGIFKFMDGGDTDDIFAITVAGGTGATTLSTTGTGGDGVSADITVDADGAIILDAADTGAEAVKIEAPAGSIKIGTTLADAKTLTLGNTNSTYISLEPHGTAGSEKILIKNTAGDTDAAAADGAIKIEAAAGGIGLDAALDIRMSAAGGNVIMDDGTNSIFDFDTANAIFTVYDDADTDGDRDYFRVAVTNNGKTTLSTHSDSNSTVCDLDLLADGGINFDASAGYIGFRKGTSDESSIANEYAYIHLNSAGSLNDFQWYGYGNGSSATQTTRLLSFTDSKRGASTAKPTIRVGSDVKLEFHDAGQYIHAPSDNNLSGVAPYSITLNAGAAGSTLGAGAANSGAVLVGHSGIHIGGTGTGAGIASIAANTSPIRIFKAVGNVYNADPGNASEANFPFNGDGSSEGDVDDSVVAEAGDLVISNRSAINNTTGIAEGKIVFDGAVEYDTLNTTGNVVVGGNLTVNGSVTTVNSTTMTVDDPILTLGGDTAPGSDDNKDRGIEFRYHDGSTARVGFMGWDDSLSGFALYNVATNTAETFDGTKSDLTVGKLLVDGNSNHISVASNVLTLTAGTSTELISAGDVVIDITTGALVLEGSGTKLEFGDANGGEYISGDTTNLTVASGGAINLNATTDVVIPVNVGVTFGAGEKIEGNDTDLTVTSGGDINLTATGDVNLPASVGLTFGANTNKIEVDGSHNMSIITANDMTLQTGGAAGDVFTIRNGADNSQSARLQIGSNDVYIEREGGNNNVTFKSTTRPLQLWSTGQLTFQATADLSFNFKTNDTPTLNIGKDGSDTTILASHTGDLIFNLKDPNAGGNPIREFMRIDNDAEELVLPQGHKVTFDGVGGGESIYADGSQNLQIVAGADITLTPGGNDVTIASATAQLNFNNSDSRIYVDSGELKFRDSENTTPLSLERLAELTPSATNSTLFSVGDSGEKRAKSTGGMVISSRDKYITDTNIYVNGTPNPSDLFFYVGDNAGTRLNSAFKNNVAVSGSISMVDTSDALSSTKFTQTSDNFILSMNTSTAGAAGAFHNILTIEPAIGLKLGTTAGSGNAGLYFQDTTLNLQKVTKTFDGSAQACIQVQGHIIPKTPDTSTPAFNLGCPEHRFANLYTGDLHLSNMGSSNDVDGTSGNWTIQEGEDNLFVINNLTGKKFKMMLQPVEDGE